jgi:hypothetical protein
MRLPEARGGLRDVQVHLFAAVVPLLVRLRLSRLERVLEPHRAPRRATPEELASLAAAIDDSLARAPGFVRRGCLTRGVTLYFFLRRAGADVALVFGMGKHGGAYAGHCWLVKDGEPYLEPKDPRELFAEMYAIPRGGGSPA